MKKYNQRGIAAIETVLILVIVALVGFVGYKVYTTKQNTDKASQNSVAAGASVAKSSLSATVPEMNSTNDLTSAQSTLDQTNPDDSTADLDQLSSQLSAF